MWSVILGHAESNVEYTVEPPWSRYAQPGAFSTTASKESPSTYHLGKDTRRPGCSQ